MVRIENLENAKLSSKNGTYGGAAGFKDGIIYDFELWMVKYPKNIEFMKGVAPCTHSSSPLSEFIGSNIYGILGYPVHKTILGRRRNQLVVACKDFVDNNYLMEIRTLKNHVTDYLGSELEKRNNELGQECDMDIQSLLMHLEYNPILKDIPDIKERFWEQAIIDIFINNNDRNNGNWGILRSIHNIDRLAPIFDNGACLSTKVSEDKIIRLLSDEKLLKESALSGVTAYYDNGKQLSIKQFIKKFQVEEDFAKAVLKVVPLIETKLRIINDFINNIPTEYAFEDGYKLSIMSEERKEFYIKQMQIRLDTLLKPLYVDCVLYHLMDKSDSTDFFKKKKV